MVSCETCWVGSVGYIRFSVPDICWGDHFHPSRVRTIRQQISGHGPDTRTLQIQACNDEALFRLKLLVLSSFVHRNTLYETVLHFRFEAALDKTGGLTEALALADAARAAGMKVMVGCMVASSLSMAPGIVLAQKAEVVHLDGPLLLARDCEPSLRYEGATLFPDGKVWSI